ncbi:MAG: vWA domain-containing protein [Myxococcota bacterium]
MALVRLVLAGALAVSMGCGAKTGLYVPDGGDDGLNRADSSFDAGVDAPMMDAAIDVPCIEVPFDGGPVEVDLEVEAEVGAADIIFLIDVSASMGEEIERIRSRLRDQLSIAIDNAIPDSRLAVATFVDFPVGRHGSAAAGDNPFELRRPATEDLASLQAAVDSITLGDGGDIQESQVEALFQLATGAGRGTFIPPSAGCPMGGLGYACVRRNALPIVLLFTDAAFHNGPGGSAPYGRDVIPTPATYDEAVSALNALDMVVIGFDSGDGVARRDLEQIAADTSRTTEPLVFDIGTRGQRLGTQVVSAIETFAGTIEQDIDAILLDGDPADGINALDLVEAIVPLRASPPDGVGGIDVDAAVFRDAQAGTLLTWQIVVRNDVVAPGPRPQRVRLEVVFRGDMRRRIRREFIDIVIPGEDGTGCEGL